MSNKRIRISDPNAVRQYLDEIIQQRVGIAPEVIDIVFDDMAMDMQTQAKMKLTANMSVLTGLLRSSITTTHEFLRKVIGTNVEYAKHVEFGTSPHMINSPVLIKTPDNAKGFWRFIKMHRGSKAKPYLRPAFNEVLQNMESYITPYFE
jgi:phage gpG-like protein